MGAQIEGSGTNTLTIEGVDELYPAKIDTIPDRIEAGTLLIATAITKGKLKLKNINNNLLQTVILKLESTGCKIKSSITTN